MSYGKFSSLYNLETIRHNNNITNGMKISQIICLIKNCQIRLSIIFRFFAVCMQKFTNCFFCLWPLCKFVSQCNVLLVDIDVLILKLIILVSDLFLYYTELLFVSKTRPTIKMSHRKSRTLIVSTC